MNSIVVLDARSKFIENVAPAVARFALKQGFATIHTQDPFTIQLVEGVEKCPKPVDSRVKAPIEIIRIQGNMNNNQVTNSISFEDFFERVDRANGGDGLVYARSTHPQGYDVILGELYDASGKHARKFPPIKRDPVLLTKTARLAVLRDHGDLMEMVQKGAIQLMSSSEALAFFGRKSEITGVPIEELIRDAEQASQKAASHSPGSVTVDEKLKVGAGSAPAVSIEAVISPRVMNFVAGLSAELDDNLRTPEKAAAVKFADMIDNLSSDELSYIQAHGYYPSIRKKASARFDEMQIAKSPKMDE